jgi:hypothetical protein
MFRKQAVHMTAPKRRHHPTKPLQSGHRPHMTIRVRATRETWAIDCVPPTISKVAHADCCELLTRIAMELRAEYDLQPSR